MIGQHADLLITQFGVSVDLETMNLSTTVDSWYDTTPNWSTSTISVLWQSETRKDAWYLQGLLKEGDAIAFVNVSVTIQMRDVIVKDSIRYEVASISQGELTGTKAYTKLALKRMSE